jgi:hypothetical protein
MYFQPTVLSVHHLRSRLNIYIKFIQNMLKEIILPVAAFAITATSVSAFNPDMLDRANIDLTDAQTVAIERAGEMKAADADHSEIKLCLKKQG